MRPNLVVPILSKWLGISPGSGRVYDRSLAENGLRTTSKGPTPKDMTLADALRFLLAVLSGQPGSAATRAAEDVKFWQAMTWLQPPEGSRWQDFQPEAFTSPETGWTLIDYLTDLLRWIVTDHAEGCFVSLEVVNSHSYARIEIIDRESRRSRTDFFLPPETADAQDHIMRRAAKRISSVDDSILREVAELIEYRSPEVRRTAEVYGGLKVAD